MKHGEQVGRWRCKNDEMREISEKQGQEDRKREEDE